MQRLVLIARLMMLITDTRMKISPTINKTTTTVSMQPSSFENLLIDSVTNAMLFNKRYDQERSHADQLHKDQCGRSGDILERIADGVADHGSDVFRGAA